MPQQSEGLHFTTGVFDPFADLETQHLAANVDVIRRVSGSLDIQRDVRRVDALSFPAYRVIRAFLCNVSPYHNGQLL